MDFISRGYDNFNKQGNAIATCIHNLFKGLVTLKNKFHINRWILNIFAKSLNPDKH